MIDVSKVSEKEVKRIIEDGYTLARERHKKGIHFGESHAFDKSLTAGPKKELVTDEEDQK